MLSMAEQLSCEVPLFSLLTGYMLHQVSEDVIDALAVVVLHSVMKGFIDINFDVAMTLNHIQFAFNCIRCS